MFVRNPDLHSSSTLPLLSSPAWSRHIIHFVYSDTRSFYSIYLSPLVAPRRAPPSITLRPLPPPGVARGCGGGSVSSLASVARSPPSRRPADLSPYFLYLFSHSFTRDFLYFFTVAPLVLVWFFVNSFSLSLRVHFYISIS